MTSIPWTFLPRADTRVSNIRLGVWLFLASEAMFFGSLVSAYVLLRAGADAWPDTASVLSLTSVLPLTALLLAATAMAAVRPWWSVWLGVAFLGLKAWQYTDLWAAGLRPATNLMVACWFVLTGLHWLHVAGGVAAAAWMALRVTHVAPTHQAERAHALRLYWMFIDVIWIAILACFYFS